MLGFAQPEHLSAEDVEMLEQMSEVLDAGFPLAAFLQLMRVYGQALAQIADAEVRLFHLYVHEPLMRDGIQGLQVAEQMGELTARLLPFSSPVMDHVHRRLLRHFVEQDIVGHMEADLGSAASAELGRMRTAIAFADLAGYTQLTEQQGDEEAASIVERFVADVTHTLPDEARIVKTIGDEVMLVSSDPAVARRTGPSASRRSPSGPPAPADRHPRRRGALPRRRLLRARGQPRLARRGASRRRRGARHPGDRRAGREPSGVRAHRRGEAQGLLEATELYLAIIPELG